MEAMSGRVDLHLLNHDFRREGGVTMGVEFLHSNVKKNLPLNKKNTIGQKHCKLSVETSSGRIDSSL